MDLIKRQDVIDALEKVADLFPWRVPGNCDSYDYYNEAWNDAIGRAEMEIEKLPSVQPERKTGYWIDGYKRQTCSLCKSKGVRSWNYCPNCGARLKEQND